MKIPYILTKQKGEIFFITKFRASELRGRLNFQFRDPYIEYKSKKDEERYLEYIDKISKQGISLGSNEKGIQRRLQLNRMINIKKFMEESDTNFFPNAVVLSIDVSKDFDFEDEYLKAIENEVGYINIDDDSIINIIDGQHRLAGIFMSDNELIDSIEIPTVLLFNVSISTASKLFLDINGTQKPVNRSLIYDLYEEIDKDGVLDLKIYHTICQRLYTDKSSPLYRQIKMLGIGDGAISQAFFIESVKKAIYMTDLKNKEIQVIYNHIYAYLRAYQIVFKDDWPVPIYSADLDFDKLDKYAYDVLKVKKSQLLKTNGFGAIMNVFPRIFRLSNGNYIDYLDIVETIGVKLNWEEYNLGTGKKIQQIIKDDINEILDDIESAKNTNYAVYI